MQTMVAQKVTEAQAFHIVVSGFAIEQQKPLRARQVTLIDYYATDVVAHQIAKQAQQTVQRTIFG
jgi:hypothetical protein